ncbi:PREDICTED: serine protease gd-like isoform X2 [Dinoponera quadriceps]|uniref:Serine protease gd-like isoform X2 n=1 Tax=Dinoponera quadriceps TaxID=609295 RepID=A0A6P3YFS3_DINQU|nr:PREDICTED: serine protease gd-like isoform X2 [Dinoponera quadriceps]
MDITWMLQATYVSMMAHWKKVPLASFALTRATFSFTMDKFSVVTALLLQLSRMLMEVSGQSACLEYFTYIYDPSINEIVGQIQILSPPKNVELHLRDYVGELELTRSIDDSIKIVQQGGPLTYRIYFPLRQPLPILTSIKLNNQVYCTGPRALGNIVTSIVLLHTLFPPMIIPSMQNVSSDVRLEDTQTYTDASQLSTRLQQQPHQPHQPQPSEKYNECGRNINVRETNIYFDMTTKTSPGQWSWLVAFFFVENDFRFKCFGSLVTHKHILTVAHCFKNSEERSQNIPPSAMLAYLGRDWQHDGKNMGCTFRELESYKAHPDYKHQWSGDSDLAIVVLRTSVEYSPTIRPICLWTGSSDLQDMVNKSALSLGFGKDVDMKVNLKTPRIEEIPIVSQEECEQRDRRFASFISNRTFCAVLKGKNLLPIDSGSNLVLHNFTTDRYELRGMATRILYNGNNCNTEQYIVFIDLAKYMSWIQSHLTST